MKALKMLTFAIALAWLPATVFSQNGARLLPASLLEREQREDNAKGERMETDRHEFTPSVLVVPKGAVQIESGYSFFKKRRVRAHTLPELLVRYGLTENVELRFRYNEAWEFGEEHREGSEDLRLGTKLRLNNQRGLIPEAALNLLITAPTGSRDWTVGKTEFGVDYIFGWKISDRAEIYGSTGLSSDGIGDFDFLPEAAGDDFVVFSESISIGYEFSERVTGYSEFFGLFTDGFGNKEDNQVYYNMGVDYYFTNDFLIDFRVGTGLTQDSSDLFCGVGGAFRF